MRKILLTIFTLIIFISLASSATTGEVLDLKVSCEDFTCSNVNITILYPNSTTLINNQPMTSNGYYANFSLIPPINGEYNYFYSDGINSSEGNFITSPTGQTVSTQTAILYTIILIFMVFIFLLALYGAINLPMKNNKNMEGDTISINWLKYLKLACFGIAYAFMTSTLFIIWTICYAFLEWNTLGTLFYYWFRLSMVLGMLIIPTLFIMAIVKFINDKRVESYINKMGIPYYNGK